jgi:mono/diheme cytochrome c family protein
MLSAPAQLLPLHHSVRMTHKLTLVLVAAGAVATLAACSKSTSTTTTAASPASSPSTTQASATMRPAAGGLPAGVTAAMVTTGDSIFHARACARCHGADAKGAANGPDLTTSTHMHVNGTYEDFVRLITSGVPADSIKDPSHKFAMQPRGGARPAPLTDQEIRDVAAYVYSLSHK